MLEFSGKNEKDNLLNFLVRESVLERVYLREKGENESESDV